MNQILDSLFYNRDPLTVAQQLLGKKLIRESNHQVLSGIILETEAYVAFTDSASHAFRRRTERNSVMYGPPGLAYVYFVYGMHYMLNVITEGEGVPSAVLIRSLEPLEGKAEMIKRRQGSTGNLTNGPARLCEAMAIERSLNSWDLTQGKDLWIEDHRTFPPRAVHKGPRVGIGYAQKKDRAKPWRFSVEKGALAEYAKV